MGMLRTVRVAFFASSFLILIARLGERGFQRTLGCNFVTTTAATNITIAYWGCVYPRSSQVLIFVDHLVPSQSLDFHGEALEVLLTSLPATEVESSWKVDGEAGHAVVLLRFRQRDDPPSPTSNSWGSWRKRPPAKERRERQRAENYRQRVEKKVFFIFY